MLNWVFAADQSRSSIVRILKKRIADPDLNPVWHKGYTMFDVVNYCNWREMVLSRYGRCEFYGKHQDTFRDRDNPGHVTRRLVTLCYYMNREPEVFTGGGLRLYEGGSDIRIEPRNNRA
ncbi:MAG TPA: 2OG-Fe(II) oxygenase, partial [Bryobacteraceae bacterium]|nr:2OG-Fe(II) oxygenase [Bryobacteraceae bacterium]